MGSLVLTLPAPLSVRSGNCLPLLVPAFAWLLGSWIHRYRTRTAPPAMDLLDAAAITAFALAGTEPAIAFSVVFPALWFRAVYGSTRRVVLYCAAVSTGLIATLPLWGLVPGHESSVDPVPVVGVVPVLVTTVAVARHLALGLFAREESQRRDTALNELGNRLLGLTDAAAIQEWGWAAVRSVCAVTPGLRVLVLDSDGDLLRVAGHAGGFVDLPSSLPTDVVRSLTTDGQTWSPAADRAMDAAVGERIAWQCGLLPHRTDRWLLFGAPTRPAAEVGVALRLLFTQLELAMRNSTTHQDLTTQARTDSLTGLANRAAFSTALAATLRTGDTGVTVLFLDLDDFKTVNDGLGHAAGDELLRQVAQRVDSAVRADDLCARLGGDEFAVLLRDGPGDRWAADAEALAERLVEVVAAPFALMNRVAHVGVSVGLAHAEAGGTAAQVVQRADIAMYAAKAKGKNRLQSFDDGLLQADAQSVLESELAGAAEAGQLVVFYQPITSALDGHATAVEALVRWQHPTRGLIQPAAFIETAERIGAIAGIGNVVLRQACADAAAWQDGRGAPLPLHVNVSAAQLSDPAFVETVRRCVSDFSLVRGQLVLEITESMVVRAATVQTTLDAVVAAGVTLAIDDFGTGYSALTTLRSLPLAIVKIDRSFVAGCPADPADQAVVEAIVQMARRLGLTTVAEGVERPEQEAFLREIGADTIQGYLHARPAPAAEFARWLQARSEATAVPVSPRPAGATLVRLPARRAG